MLSIMAEDRIFKTKELKSEPDCRLLRPGHWAMLQFVGEVVWYKRLLLFPCARDFTAWICVTPDGLVGPEGFFEKDTVKAYGLANFSDRPQDPNHSVYDFGRPPAVGDIKKWMETAKIQSTRLLIEKGEVLTTKPRWFLFDGEWLDMENGFFPVEVNWQANMKVSFFDRGTTKISLSQSFELHEHVVDHPASCQEVFAQMTGTWRDGKMVEAEVDSRVFDVHIPAGELDRRRKRWRLVADAIVEESLNHVARVMQNVSQNEKQRSNASGSQEGRAAKRSRTE